MADFINEVFIDGQDYEFCTTTLDEIKPFLFDESLRHYRCNTDIGNVMYLGYNEEDFAMVDIFCMLHEGKIVSFCVRPKYAKETVLRIYTTPEYRGKGLATYMLNNLAIGALACAKSNTHALGLYKSLGFEMTYERQWGYELKRDVNSINFQL